MSIEVYKKKHTGASLTVEVVFTIFMLFSGTLFLLEFIKIRPAIVLSNKGVELRFEGFFSWENVESYRTYYYGYNNYSRDLIFNLKDGTSKSVNLDMLQMDWKEILSAISEIKPTQNILYEGDFHS